MRQGAPRGHEPDHAAGKEHDQQADNQEQQELDGQHGIAESPRRRLAVGVHFSFENGQERRADNLFADEEEGEQAAFEGGNVDGFDGEGTQVVSHCLELDQAGNLEDEMGYAHGDAGAQDPVAEAVSAV